MPVGFFIVSPNDFPIYSKIVDPTEDLEVVAFTSLDMIEEKVSAYKNIRASYIGNLCFHIDYRIYGYVSPSNYKFILIYRREGDEPRDVDIREAFSRINSAVITALCNPFYEPETPLNSRYKFKHFYEHLPTYNVDSIFQLRNIDFV